MIIRYYQEKDKAEVLSLYLEVGKEFFPEINFEHPEISEYLVDLFDINTHYFTDGGAFWIIKDKEKIIGIGGVKLLDNETAELRKFRIAYNYRGKLLGRKLLIKCEDLCKSRKISKIILETADRFLIARKLYENHGYEVIKEEDVDLQGAKFKLLVLKKQL